MDKVTKFLLKISERERNVILSLIEKISILNLAGLDVKKIKWENNLYRIRKAKIRIVFKKLEDSWIIIDINYRDKIYKDL